MQTDTFKCKCGNTEIREANDAPWPTCRLCRALEVRKWAGKKKPRRTRGKPLP